VNEIIDRLDSHDRRIRGARNELHELAKDIDKLDDHLGVCIEKISGLINRIVLDVNSLDERVERYQEAADEVTQSQDQFMFSIKDRLDLVEHAQLDIRSDLAEIKRRLEEMRA